MDNHLCQRLNAGYDKNGNRKALWLEYNFVGDVIGVYVEYYNKPKDLFSVN